MSENPSFSNIDDCLISFTSEDYNQPTLAAGVISNYADTSIFSAVPIDGLISFNSQDFTCTNYIDYPSAFNLFFGSGSQNSSTLVINKADLPGLTASANNTAESLLVALVNRWLATKADVNGKVTVSYWGAGFEDGKRIDTILVDLFNQLTVTNYEIQSYSSTVLPNNY